MQNTSKINTVLLVIIIILLGVGIFVLLGKNNIDNRNDLNNNGQEVENVAKDIYNNQNQSVDINKTIDQKTSKVVVNKVVSTTLPQYVGTSVGAGVWPPVITGSFQSYYCNNIGIAPNSEGNDVTAQRVINGKSYCIHILSDGYAGGRGYSYTYTTSNGNGTKVASFGITLSSCGVYGGQNDPKYKECKTSQDTFLGNLDSLIDSLMN